MNHQAEIALEWFKASGPKTRDRLRELVDFACQSSAIMASQSREAIFREALAAANLRSYFTIWYKGREVPDHESASDLLSPSSEVRFLLWHLWACVDALIVPNEPAFERFQKNPLGEIIDSIGNPAFHADDRSVIELLFWIQNNRADLRIEIHPPDEAA